MPISGIELATMNVIRQEGPELSGKKVTKHSESISLVSGR